MPYHVRTKLSQQLIRTNMDPAANGAESHTYMYRPLQPLKHTDLLRRLIQRFGSTSLKPVVYLVTTTQYGVRYLLNKIVSVFRSGNNRSHVIRKRSEIID